MDKLAFDSKAYDAAIAAGAGSRLFEELKTEHGICFDAVAEQQRSPLFWTRPGLPLKNFHIAMDVQSELVTVSNAGVPAFMATWVDPKVIAVLVSPMMAAIIAGESGKGDWTSEVIMFLTAEATGESSSYGDYSRAGQSSVNVNFPQRQNYLFQSFLQYGQREVAMAGLAKLDWVSLQQQANALTLMKALNFMYFYGVGNLENYGLINDPSLPPSLTPTFSWLTSASATANTIYQDIVRMFIQLQGQSGGTVKEDARIVLAMSPQNALTLKYITQYNTNSVEVLLKQNFPNIRIETAVQYATPSGQLVQMFVEEVEGQRTVECVFSSKLMAHMMETLTSSWAQKRSSGGYGTVWYRPYLCASLLG
jgi:hypothetical protein